MPNLQKLSSARVVREGLCCSFCNKPPADDNDIVAGQDVYICGECIAICTDVLSGEARDEDSSDNEDGPALADDPPEQRAASVRPMPFRLLSQAEVARLVPIGDLINEMRETLRRFSSGETVQPLRTVFPLGRDHALFGVMPAYLRNPDILGAKLVAVFGDNAAVDLPTHLATVLLFNPITGALQAILDGAVITELRTAAASAVSADLLARDDADSLAIIGTGIQARSHLRALDALFELSQIRVWSPTSRHQLAFLEEMESETQATLVGADSAEQAIAGADLVVLATSSSEPVVQSEWIKAGAHVISVGACRPNQREMDPALVLRGRLFVDSRVSALAESGDVVLGIQEGRFTASHIAGELGELVAGKVDGRRSPRDVTIFKSLGLAVEDLAAADLAYRRAMTQGVGQELEL